MMNALSLYQETPNGEERLVPGKSLWTTIPRADESLIFAGELFTVVRVSHNFDTGNISIILRLV